MPSGGAAGRAAALRQVVQHARWQSGVFSRVQAREAGVSAAMIRSRLGAGVWLAYRGAFRLPEWPDTAMAKSWAAILVGGPGTILTGTSALLVTGDVPDAPVPVICLPRDRHVDVPGCLVLREPHDPGGPVLRGGFRIASRDRAVIDALRVLPRAEAVRIADVLGGAGVEVAALIEGWRATHPGARGNGQLQEILGLIGDGARSHAERLLHRILRRAGIAGWVANMAVHDAAGLIGLVDVGFPGERVAVEIDGRAYHSDVVAFQHDRTRQNRLVRAGWTVLRFTWDDLARRPSLVASTVESILKDARQRRGA